MDEKLIKILKDFANDPNRNLTVLTGAGISAESGIPTFRGKEGYWTVGSKEYHPQEMATLNMFLKKPDEVWKWYLYRFNVCTAASPNKGHMALVELEKLFGDRFTLITQNVDGLHLRAGNSIGRTYHIHGNIFYMRCADECSEKLFKLPESFIGRPKNKELDENEKKLLICPDCGAKTRPHVLWFDETYNEHFYKFQSSLRAAENTHILIIVGTSGATNLPNQVAYEVARRKGIIIDINIEENPFSRLAKANNGFFIRKSSIDALDEILAVCR